jgi:hypothetical protein
MSAGFCPQKFLRFRHGQQPELREVDYVGCMMTGGRADGLVGKLTAGSKWEAPRRGKRENTGGGGCDRK